MKLNMKCLLMLTSLITILFVSSVNAQFGGAINKIKEKTSTGSIPVKENTSTSSTGSSPVKENASSSTTDQNGSTDTKGTADQTKGFVSDFHKAHVGEIFFCKETKPDLALEHQYISSFNANDDITACVYLQPIQSWSRKYQVKMFINDEQPGFIFHDQVTDYTAAFYLRILRKMGSTESNDFVNKVLQLSSGTYKVRLEIWGSTDGYATTDLIAKGEFNLNKEVKGASASGKFSEIKVGMSNATFEQQAIKLVMEKATREHWSEKYTKAKIVSTDWEIEKDEFTGAILCRKIYMKLYGVWPNGECKAVDFGFRQDYKGAGQYSSTLQYNSIGDMRKIECE